ncbi:MAG: nitrilase-related carbon-nitrogen hydrolase [Candidatus Hodarchaeota archaeon]
MKIGKLGDYEVMLEKVRISCVQYAYKPISSFEDFAKDIEKLMNQGKDSDFIVFPETFTLELQYLIPNYNISKLFEFTNDYIELFTNLSKDRDQYIIAGSHLLFENEKEYNTGHLFSPDGTIFTHRKTHLFPLELALGVSPGNKLEIFETEKAKVALAICYEMEFPEVCRTYTLKGAEIIFCPSNTVDKHGFWRVRHCSQASAIQNQVYIAHSCLVGNPPLKGMEGWGKSAIMSPCEPPWSPNGVIVEANENEEAVITADLDLKLLHRKRKRASAPTLKDRRPEIYEL